MLTNNVISENLATFGSGGLAVAGSVAHLLHNTIAHNSGGAGGGLFVTGSSDIHSTVALTNTIMVSQTVGINVTANNTATLNGVLWFGDGMNTGGAGTITITNAYTGNPAFAADGYHLTSASEAIDKGIDTGVITDIDSEPRFGIPDLGADEFITFTITRGYLPLVLGQGTSIHKLAIA